MIRNILILLIACLLISSGCKSRTIVRKINTDDDTPLKKKDLNGVTYRLPRTVVSVTVPVKLATEEPGPYLKFLPCFFPDTPEDEITRTKSRKIQVQAPTFDSFGEPDPKENYMVSIKGGIFENKSLLMEFAPRGVLKKGEASSENKSVEFAVKALQTSASIAGSVIAARDLNNPEDATLEDQAANCYRKLKDDVKAAKLAQKDATAQGDFESYLAANAAWLKLTELQKRRDSMISSQSDGSADSFKLRLTETDKSIDGYRQLFFGLTAETVWSAVFQWRPEQKDPQYSKPLLVLIPEGSEEGRAAGICVDLGLVKDDGVLPPKKFKAGNCSAVPDGVLQAVWIELERDKDDKTFLNKMEAVNKLFANEHTSRGWYFRIAAKGNLFLQQGPVTFVNAAANATADWKGKALELGRTNMPIAQIGVVASIPASGGGLSHQSALELNGITGELVNFKYSSTALLEKERLSEIQGAAESIVNATDPLTKKKRELEKLKTEQEIRDINANLNPQP